MADVKSVSPCFQSRDFLNTSLKQVKYSLCLSQICSVSWAQFAVNHSFPSSVVLKENDFLP